MNKIIQFTAGTALGILSVFLLNGCNKENGDGYALRAQLDIPVSDLPENVRETVHLGMPFKSADEIESWLETLES